LSAPNQIETVYAINYLLVMGTIAIDNQEMPWGGKRKGAGRKAELPTGKRELISARVEPSTAEKLKAEAKRRGVTVGRIIDEWAKRA
jgi:hypothetical protein